MDLLTDRERETLLEAARGATTKEVAHSLGLSLQTTKNHLSATYRKLGVEGLVEAIWVLWLEEHLGERPGLLGLLGVGLRLGHARLGTREVTRELREPRLLGLGPRGPRERERPLAPRHTRAALHRDGDHDLDGHQDTGGGMSTCPGGA